MNNSDISKGRSLTTPTIDFLLLGGASLYVWIIVISVSLFSNAPKHQFMYLAIGFSWLSIICNYPHFLISYRFGYGRGKKFILKHWPALIAMPVLLILLYTLAYFYFDQSIKYSDSVNWFNRLLQSTGMDYKFGDLPNLGIEIMSLSVRVMYITSAWHYSKQAFGCIMVFSHYQKYPLTIFQRNLWKVSLYSIAVYNFFYISNLTSAESGSVSFFMDMPVRNSAFPEYTTIYGLAVVAILALAVLYFIILKNYRQYKVLPTSSVIIPWIALHFWWIPFLGYNDFLFLAVPFFHSLQYLLFAYQLEAPEKDSEKLKKIRIIVIKTLILFLVGYLAFEYFPNTLDSALSVRRQFHISFFLVAIPVFINIHHFFIDSVVWRFSDEHVRKKLLD